MSYANSSSPSLAFDPHSNTVLYAWVFSVVAAVGVVSVLAYVCHKRQRARRLRQLADRIERGNAVEKYNELVEKQGQVIDEYTEIASRMADEQRPLTLEQVQALREKLCLRGDEGRHQFLKAVSRSAESIDALSVQIQGLLEKYPDYELGMSKQGVEGLIAQRVELHKQFKDLACRYLEKVEAQLTPEDVRQHLRNPPILAQSLI